MLLATCLGASASAVTAAEPADSPAVESSARKTHFAAALAREIEGEFSAEVIGAVLTAYAGGDFKPLWTERGIDSLAAARKTLFRHGLVADDVMDRDLRGLIADRLNAATPDLRLRTDLRMTAAWLRMAGAVHRGENGALDSDGLSLMVPAAAKGEADDLLDEFEPAHPQYRGLKAALRHYRELKSAGGWLAIPGGAILRAGDHDARLPALRHRLRAEGFTPTTNPPTGAATGDPALLFDAGLEQALMEFQTRHGLEPDGVLGPNTLAALNESPASKIDRIADTMMRWRRQEDMGPRYIWANIPSYTAEGWAGGAREISMRTIVGKASRQTPIFSDEIEYTVANPKWYVPVSIASRDKRPKLARDPSYAARKNFRIFDRASGRQVSAWDVDWTDPSSARKYRLVQGPGEDNALGELKIIFPNQYSVYLHGTPGKALFDRAQRAFSSGCVRLEDPVAMASWLARYDSDVARTEIEDALASGENTRLDYGDEAAVHITYMTVTVAEDGTPYFWRDIYKRDDGIQYVERYASL